MDLLLTDAPRPVSVYVFLAAKGARRVCVSSKEGTTLPQLTISDQTTAGETTGACVLDLLTERITICELIRSRVYQEVQDYNLKQGQVFNGLVQPEETEKTLTGWKLKKPRQLDWKRQLDRALEAFEGGQILILVNDRQAESLDEEIVLEPQTTVTFLRLLPLVGG